MKTDVLFLDTDLLLDKNQSTSNLWAFLINYLIKVDVLKQSNEMKPFYKLIIIREQNTRMNHLDYRESEVMKSVMQIDDFDDTMFNSIILILKKSKKYFCVVHNNISQETLLCDFGYNQKQLSLEDHLFIAQTILQDGFGLTVNRDLLKKRFQSIVELRESDNSEMVFAYLLSLSEGQKQISFNLLDVVPWRKRLEYVVIKTGMNDLERIYADKRALENQEKQKRFVELQKVKQLEDIDKHHLENPFEQPIRLITPEKPDELDQYVTQLENRLKHLKGKTQEPDPDFLINELVKQKQIKRTKLDEQIDKELEELDKLVLTAQELKQQSAITKLPLFESLYQLAQGKADEKLFQGLGLNKNMSKSEILSKLQHQNAQKIVQPNLFMPQVTNDPKKQVMVYRYGIQITRQMIIDFRTGFNDPKIIDVFLGFLGEVYKKDTILPSYFYDDLNSYFMLGRKVDIYEDKHLFQQSRAIYLPVHAGLQYEYQLVKLDLKEFKIIHYTFAQLPAENDNNRHKIVRYWQDQVNPQDKVNMQEARILQQEKAIKIVIEWIKHISQKQRLQGYADMKLWKVRMEQNTIASARDSGLLMLLQSCFMILGGNQIPNNLMIDSMRRIVEYTVVQLGVMKELNQQSVTFFHKEMYNLMENRRQ